MWQYEQATGRLRDENGTVQGVGYSGRYPDGKNKPEMQDEQNVGPIPAGEYSIGLPVDTVTHGPFVLPLVPDPKNQMFGRSAFLIHGDSVVAPGTASEGCIIMARDVRQQIAKSGDNVLEVIAVLNPTGTNTTSGDGEGL